jgi:hypothetical protein
MVEKFLSEVFVFNRSKSHKFMIHPSSAWFEELCQPVVSAILAVGEII